MTFVDLNYYYISYRYTILDAINQFRSSFGYVPYLNDSIRFIGIMHMNGEGSTNWNGASFNGFSSKNRFHYIPFGTHNYIRSLKPDVVLVQGTIYPLQVIHLRWVLGGKCKIIVQHHGEQPFVNSIKRFLQRIADRYISAYLFTSRGNAENFINQRVIASKDKCYEVLEASTFLTPVDKQVARKELNMSGNQNFLWVGRLIESKDPFTVLKAFDAYVNKHPEATLYMIYHTHELLQVIMDYISTSDTLSKAIRLIGKVPHPQLAIWYSAVDFFISGSHREGSGYALIECMACGCIPIITDIPPFKKVAAGHALYYSPGDAEALYEALKSTGMVDKALKQGEIITHFRNNLSFSKIAADMEIVISSLM